MDNVCHTLVGAACGAAGLNRRTRFGAATLMISANVPDVDVLVFASSSPWIEFRRGWTHGILAQIVLPVALTGFVWLFDRFRRARGSEGERPFHPGWTLLLAFVGVYSHVFLDYLNNYGVRLLTPINWQWFYGDAIFIVDPWIWIMLILGLEMSWRAERLGKNWTRPAAWAFAAMLGYIALNFAISARAVAATRPLVERVAKPQTIEAGEVPLTFWKRKMIWRGDGLGGTGTYNPLDGLNRAWLDPKIVPLNLDDPRLAAAAKRDAHVRAFLFWSRMPMVYMENGRAYLTDQRFFESGRASSSHFLIPLDNRWPSP